VIMKISNLILVLFTFFAFGCGSQSSDESQPGSCKLECSDRKVPSSSFKLEPLFNIESLTCREAADGVPYALDPIVVRYRVYEPLSGNPGTPGRAVDPENCLDRDERPNGPYGPCERMIGGVGFEPWIIGAAALSATNDEHLNPAKTIASPAKFEGIVTSRSEWCSDTCGIMTYEVSPMCLAGGFTAGILSGGIKMQESFSFNIDVDAADDE
jgi:hypothetical protein